MTEEEQKERCLNIHRERNDLIQGDDGFYVYWPLEPCGYICAHQLRWIADELDRLNEPWQKHLNEYFENLAPEESAEHYEF